MELCDLVTKLAVLHGPSGREQAVADAIAELARPFVDELSIDAMGNLIAHKHGEGPKLMLTAHMDTTGFVATYLKGSGMVRVSALGTVHPEEVINAVVRFENGTEAVVRADCDLPAKELTVDNLYLDLGASDKAEAAEKIQLGDTAVFEREPRKLGKRLLGAGLDNRISCAVLLKAMEDLENSKFDLYFVFTAQEELGLRGAKTAAFTVAPDYAVVLETTNTLDYPGAKKVTNAVLGGGACIKVMDKSIICHPTVVHKLTELAREQDITFQMQVTSVPGTDGGAIHQSRTGVKTGVISVPCRYEHSPAEMIELSDAEACVRLVKAVVGCKL